MLQEEVRQAVRLISNAHKGGVLLLDALLSIIRVLTLTLTVKQQKMSYLIQSRRKVISFRIPALRLAVSIDETCLEPIIFKRITVESIKAMKKIVSQVGRSIGICSLWLDTLEQKSSESYSSIFESNTDFSSKNAHIFSNWHFLLSRSTQNCE